MVHIFDVDHTLYRGSTVRDYLRWGLIKRGLPASLFLGLPWMTLRVLLNGPDLLGEEFGFFKGLDEFHLKHEAVQMFEAWGRNKMNEGLVNFIDEKKTKGEEVILATSSFDFIVEPVADFLGVRKTIAVELQFIDGLSTGRIISIPPFGKGKLSRVEELAENKGWSWEECSFYTDSYRDLPLLEKVRFPVAVNPDRRLGKKALNMGWMIKE